jgi:hypothetical protein
MPRRLAAFVLAVSEFIQVQSSICDIIQGQACTGDSIRTYKTAPTAEDCCNKCGQYASPQCAGWSWRSAKAVGYGAHHGECVLYANCTELHDDGNWECGRNGPAVPTPAPPTPASPTPAAPTPAQPTPTSLSMPPIPTKGQPAYIKGDEVVRKADK